MDRSILTKDTSGFRNKVFGSIEWTVHDNDHNHIFMTMDADEFFNNDKLIKVLAFLSTPYNFKDAHATDVAFGNHIGDFDTYYLYDGKYSDEYNEIRDIIKKNNLFIYSYYGPAESIDSIDLSYLDKDGNFSFINFSSVIDQWKDMTYEEIIKYVIK